MKVPLVLDVQYKQAEPNKGFMPRCNWDNNYNDFTIKSINKKGTITYINGVVSIILDGKHSFRFDLQPLINEALFRAYAIKPEVEV